MPKGRFVSKSIATSEQLGATSFAADFLFARCLPHLDVEGRMTGNPQLLKAMVVPLRPEIPAAEIPALLTELAEALDLDGVPLVYWYEVAGQRVLAFPGFERNQQGMKRDREAASRLPAPTDRRAIALAGPGLESAATLAANQSGATPDALRTNSPVSEAEGELKLKRSEARGRATAAAPSPSSPSTQTASTAGPGLESAATLAALPLSQLRERFRQRFYSHDGADARWAEVEGQLDALLSPGGCLDGRRGHRKRIHATQASLSAALRATLAEGVRNPDRAIVVVLRKCEEGPANELRDARGRLATDGASADAKATEVADARDLAQRWRDCEAWLAEHPDEAAGVRAQVEQTVPASSGFDATRRSYTISLVEQLQSELQGAGT